MKKALIYSLLCHLLLVGITYIILKKGSHLTVPTLVRQKTSQINITLAPSLGIPKSHGQSSSGKSKLQAQRGKETPRPQFKDLNLGAWTGQGANKGSSNTPGGGSSGSSQGTPDGYDVANTIGIEKEGELYPFFSALWKRIDTNMGYPDDFVQERIQGPVTIHLNVNRQGVFTGGFLKVDANSLILKTYVMAVLVHALDTPLPKLNWADRDEMTLVAQVDFSVFGIGESPRERRENHVKNMLYFTRDAYVDPKLNQEIKRIFTKYLPPIIPLPGAFYIDFFRAYQMVKGFSTPDPNDLRKDRLVDIKENWQRVIQKSSEQKPQPGASPHS